jgi:hypothetical protein
MRLTHQTTRVVSPYVVTHLATGLPFTVAAHRGLTLVGSFGLTGAVVALPVSSFGPLAAAVATVTA